MARTSIGAEYRWTEAILYEPSYRRKRGGSFGTSDSELHAAHPRVNDHVDEGESLGFSVAEVSEPAALLLRARGAFTMMKRRRADVQRP